MSPTNFHFIVVLMLFALACSGTAPVPTGPNTNLDATPEAGAEKEREAGATVEAKEKELVAEQPTATPYLTDAQLPFLAATAGKIAFVSDRDGDYQIFVMNPDGSQQTRLSDIEASSRDPSWSPDGNRIAFTSYQKNGPEKELYVINGDGSKQTKLMATDDIRGAGTSTGANLNPSWSPDSERIIFVLPYSRAGKSGQYGNHIVIMNSDGSGHREIEHKQLWDKDVNWGITIEEASYRYPSWSPDGKDIVFVERSGIYVLNNEEYLGRQGLKAEFRPSLAKIPTFNSDSSQPSWSPVGKSIAFSTRSGSIDIGSRVKFRSGGSKIFVTSLQTSAYTGTISDAAARRSRERAGLPSVAVPDDRYPSWSPDGKRIAFLSGSVINSYDIYVANYDGTSTTGEIRLTYNGVSKGLPSRPGSKLSWSPDGVYIAFAMEREGNTDI